MCMLSNVNKMAYFYTACVVLHVLLVRYWREILLGFKFYAVTHFYSSHLFLCALGPSYAWCSLHRPQSSMRYVHNSRKNHLYTYKAWDSTFHVFPHLMIPLTIQGKPLPWKRVYKVKSYQFQECIWWTQSNARSQPNYLTFKKFQYIGAWAVHTKRNGAGEFM